MITPKPRPNSLPPSSIDLRLSALGRRISASGSLAAVLADLAFGVPERDDTEALHFTTGARVAEAVGARL